MKVLLAAIGELPGLDREDPLGLGYVAAHLERRAEVVLAGFVSVRELDERLARERPARLLLSSFTGAGAATMAAVESSRRLGIPVVLGGPGFAAPARSRALDHPGIDLVVFGEADAVDAGVLLGARGDGGPGVYARGGSLPDRPAILADPDAAAPPLRPMLASGRTDRARVAASRGCPLSCSYCAAPLLGRAGRVGRGGWRERRADSIGVELAKLAATGARSVSFTDGCATPPLNGRARLGELARAAERAGLRFSAMLSPKALEGATDAEVRSWRSAGLERAFILLNAESGFDDGGRLAPESALVIHRLRDAGVEIELGAITIDPMITAATFLARLSAVAALEPAGRDSYVRPLLIVPGTPAEERWRRLPEGSPPGPRTREAGVEYGFQDAGAARAIEDFLSFLDGHTRSSGADLAKEVGAWARARRL